MIDFKAIVKNLDDISELEAAEWINSAETRLAAVIRLSPKNERWEVFKEIPQGFEKAHAVVEYLHAKYVKTGKTQMAITMKKTVKSNGRETWDSYEIVFAYSREMAQ